MNTNLLGLDTKQLLRALGHATDLSTMSGGAASHGEIVRFLSGKDPDSPKLGRQLKPLVRKLEEGVSITDDDMGAPYADEGEPVRWCYDLSQDETVEGINLLNTLYQSGELSLHEAFALLKSASPGGDRITLQQLSLPVYGNYCGAGHGDRTGRTPPTDAVDAVCREHDRCYRRLGDFDFRCDRALIRDMPSAIANTTSPVGKSVGFLALLHFSSTLLPSRRPRR